MSANQQSIEHNFRYHAPVAANQEKHARLREKSKELALLIDELLPPAAARERATALKNIEQAMMWACAGICRHPETTNEAKR